MVEPAQADPHASTPLVGVVLGLAFLVCSAGAANAAVRRTPRALAWAQLVAAASVALLLACELTEPHQGWGSWWIGELLVSATTGLLAARGAAAVGS
jgi:hypothetical protein